ncbi:hypothetical protein H072_1426 [Dactylellina haptotyla CBS 200.50]|uniref:Haloacid dehalogenase n=1 Tax=Dactylellina haptotyla (strain CBS 200.50) TaxID=1284197 RepID=S8CA99_DACHA|nr:hypothetical protein H072_1426 [Dactylellina haptotyla CBS 200.50]
MDTETSTYIDNIVDRRIIVAFDLFGTLLSTDSISQKLAEYHGDKAVSISNAWRKYQLEYTWRLNSMGFYEPFDSITKKSLLHALSESSIPHDDSQITVILSSYASLSAFPDVKPCLDAMQSIKHIQPIIFTNGTSKMVQSAVENTPELDELFHTIRDNHLSADEIEKYKPHPMIYQYLAAKVGKSIDPDEKHGGIDEVVLISANPFDIAGAQAVGITGVWVDRAGNGWHDCLVKDGPKHTLKSLEELKGVLEGMLGDKRKVWDEADGRNKD